MPARSTTRSVLCLLLLLCLCAPLVPFAAASAQPDPSAAFRAGLHDTVRHRASAPSVFLTAPVAAPVLLECAGPAAIPSDTPRLLWTGAPPTGRSPPPIS